MNDIHALSGAYAVDALDDLERRGFEEHLARCPDCREEVAGLRETAALLAGTTAQEPPPALRAAVLSGITQVRPLPPSTAPASRPARRPWLPLLVAAAVLAAVGIGGTVWQPWSDDGGTVVVPSATDRVLQAPDAEEFTVSADPTGTLTVVRSERLGQAVLVTDDLAAAPDGKVYEVWLQSDEGAMEPAGLLPPGQDHEFLLEGDAATATGAGITVEPPGGSRVPTSDPIALFDFSKGA